MRLRDAFEEIHGSLVNPDSKRAQEMTQQLMDWEERGAAALEAAAGRHDQKLLDEYGRRDD